MRWIREAVQFGACVGIAMAIIGLSLSVTAAVSALVFCGATGLCR